MAHERRDEWSDPAKGPLAALAPRIKACVVAKRKACLKAPAGDGCADVWADCEDAACVSLDKAADKALSRAEVALKRQVLDCLDDCAKTCEAGNSQTEQYTGCWVVSVNACAAAVGLVCPDPAGGVTADEVEVRLPPDAGR